MAAEKLTDLTHPIDIPSLDEIIAVFNGTGSEEERASAGRILRDLQNNPEMFNQVAHILLNTQNLDTKLFALQVLEDVIKNRWNELPVEQIDGMKNYFSEIIVKLSSDEQSFRQERIFVGRLNIILVQILKHGWSAKWKSFIPDLVAAAKTSETICENYMAILKLLIVEVFDFSSGEMTQQQIEDFKQSFNSEFQLIHELCLYVLSASQRAELTRATLATLHAFLSWMPLDYIFESPLLKILLKCFPIAAYRNLTLQCLTEVASLNFGDIYDIQYVSMYGKFMSQLQAILPLSSNIPDAYADGVSEEQAFIQNLALFFTSFFKVHICVLESSQENIHLLLIGLEYLISISYVDDTEVFKVCLTYWNSFVLELFEAHHNLDNPASTTNMWGLQMPMFPGITDGLTSKLMQRRRLYSGTMSKLRLLMISRMPKPEEVLCVENDENGNIVQEIMKGMLVQHKIMQETLVYLSHLDQEDTKN